MKTKFEPMESAEAGDQVDFTIDKEWDYRKSVLLVALALAGCSQIDTGNVGVVKTGGQYKTEELQEANDDI